MRRAVKLLLEPIDRSLDFITSYRLVLYFLLFVVAWATGLGYFDLVPFSWSAILLSAGWLMLICRASNWAISSALKIPRNSESDFITALILSLILSPADTPREFAILAGAGVLAMASKYLLALRARHIFNPAALGAFAAARLFDYYPSWWVGTAVLTPIVLIGGLLILRKQKRFLMAGVFVSLYIAILAVDIYSGNSFSELGSNLWLGLSATPLLFFATVMLIEPETSPHRLARGLIYAGFVGVLYSVHKLGISPEEALLLGNLLVFIIEPSRRLTLKLVKARPEAKNIYSFAFAGRDGLNFSPGQYMEWTLPGIKLDARGNRHYFTISSSPTEQELAITVKVPEQRPSNFKQRLMSLKPGDKIMASQLAGSFILPKDKDQKVAFIAGGVGITPFRSIIKYLLDKKEQRDAKLLYVASDPDEFVFRNLLDSAKHIGFKTIYVVSNPKESFPSWDGMFGQLDAKMIKKAFPDFKDHIFYVSGPYGMVQAAEIALLELGVPPDKIKLDYFPGYG